MPKSKLFFIGLLLFFTSSLVFSAGILFGGDACVIALPAEPSNLIPFLASDSASAQVSKLVFNGLMKYDKNLALTGDLAESWEIRDDGLVILFHLRRGVRWQDGAPFTAADVEFTFAKLTDPGTPTPYGGDFERVRSVRALDPHTVEVVYKEPFSPGLASWTMGVVPRHRTVSPRNPIGTGPYILKKWKTGDRIELWANKDYFEGRPFIDRVVYRIVPDQSTAFLELETEALDVAGLTPLQFMRQTDTAFFRKKYRKFSHPFPGYTYIGYNLKSPLFSDARVRRAIGMAVNKKEIADVVQLGRARVCTGPFVPGTWAFNPAVPETPFDPARAKALLAEAGWRDQNGDGVLDREGLNFSFTLLVNQGNEQRKMAAEMIQKRLADVGIRMQIRTVEWATLLKEFIDRQKFEAVLLAWNLSPDPDLFDIFHSSKTRPGEFNFISYKNDEVDRLLEEGRRVFPQGERAKIYHRLHEILAEEEPYTFLVVPDALGAVHARFRGVEPAPAGIAYNFNEWFVPEAERKYASPEILAHA